MFNNMQINEICTYTATLLFTSSAEQIKAIKVSTIDTEASLLSELSLINNDIQDAIEFNCSLIVTEYIDYLKKEISKINSITMDFNTAKDLVEFTSKTREVCGEREEMIFKNMLHAQSKISSIISYDIAKSTQIRPISESKTTDFILSVKERLASLYELCNNILNAITECDYLIEACNFSTYYKESVIGNYEGVPPLLEEPYETIIAGLSAEYGKWKGEIESVNKSKDNI